MSLGEDWKRTDAQRRLLQDQLKEGPLAGLLSGIQIVELDSAEDLGKGDHPALIVPFVLQDVADYRAILRQWMDRVRIGGFLILLVPHAYLFERQLTLPSRWRPQQRRLYTPGSLLAEVEEALEPNSYRVRWLSDRDAGYDYMGEWSAPASGDSDVVLVLERIAPPPWGLDDLKSELSGKTSFEYEPLRTRVESVRTFPVHRILLLKLDHLGDFIMGLPAIERVRQAFPEAHITLVVGSWNTAMADTAGVADTVIEFDLFPRNSSEEEVDVRGKTAMFDALISQNYDLAVDLRTDPDSRFLLRNVRARIKAGLGTKVEFPHLDIFLPVDFTRHGYESAKDEVISHRDFQAQPICTKSDYSIRHNSEPEQRVNGALIWGPYRWLRQGRYVFEPYFEIDDGAAGILTCDIGLNAEQVAFATIPAATPLRLEFEVPSSGGNFEFRLWTVKHERPLGFRFYGGRLLGQAASSVLHQSEYLLLLVELIVLRVDRSGVLCEGNRIS